MLDEHYTRQCFPSLLEINLALAPSAGELVSFTGREEAGHQHAAEDDFRDGNLSSCRNGSESGVEISVQESPGVGAEGKDYTETTSECSAQIEA
jgi:hypothetical protein